MEIAPHHVGGKQEGVAGLAVALPNPDTDITQEASAPAKKTRGVTAAEAGWLPAHRAIMAGNNVPKYVPLDLEIRVTVDTETAAFHLGRRPQTLRAWACRQDGPLQPVRMHGRLAWRTADLRRLLGVE